METFKLSVSSDAAKAFYFDKKKVGTIITDPWDGGDVDYLFASRVFTYTDWDGQQPIEIVP